jgi:branched-chain amino acid transport system ATP-binding protein
MLKVNNIEVRYSNVILVLRGVSLEVADGECTALLGANGAGKSTTLKGISGLLRSELGEVTEGTIEFDGERIDKMRPEQIVQMGIVQAPEGRRVCEHLTAEENLLSGGLFKSNRTLMRKNLDTVYGYFPRLKAKRRHTAGYLSGGEQQMVVIGRALMGSPRLILFDEPSMGLAPMIVKEIFAIIKKINLDQNIGILLVEQNASGALDIVNYGYVMEMGRIVFGGEAEKLKGNPDIKEFYLGLSELGERKSYREVKHYKRRKRWL